MNGKEQLFAQLEQFPEDWEIRIALIEIAVAEGDLQGAKRLVRASPPGIPTPPGIQVRLHTLLTRGVPAPLPKAEPDSGPPPDLSPPPETNRLSPESPGSDSKNGEQTLTPVPASDGLAGGLGALVETEVTRLHAASRGESRVAATGEGRTVVVDKASLKDKWRDYDGGLELVPLDPLEKFEPPSNAPERLSSFSFAILAHVAVLVLLSLVVIQVQRPAPPQLVVSVEHTREADLVTTRITRPTPEVKPSAASAQAIDVISALASSSNFNVPEVETPSDVLVASTLPGIAPAGLGMSFTGKAVDSSEVNFFGLSGSGRKIVFIIDATPEMLVDEKGGMSAYDKVKEEVGIMLATLNRGTLFNLLLYQGKELVAFRPDLVPGLPSNLRQAIEWLEPLNRDYETLGLRGDFGPSLAVAGHEDLPIAAGDVAHYTKAVQKALEWQASAIFCISVGYRGMNRAPTPEMLKKMAEMPRGDPGTVDPRAQQAWQQAIARTREWLAKENAARREKGLDPKVVINFNQLVREVTGATPPQRQGGNNAGGAAMPTMPPVTPEDIEKQVDLLVKQQFKSQGFEEPSLHMVLFLGEDEDIADADEDHFKNLTRKNRGKLKILRGLAALKNVTGSGSE